jgi:hypothetical protein
MSWLLIVLASAPCLVWTQDAGSRTKLDAAGVKKVCADAASRIPVPTPGITARAGIASPTRAPWVVANGWRFMRRPDAKYLYEVPAGKAALAAAEAFAYGADAALKIDPADLDSFGAMMRFVEGLPPADLPPVADLAVVDDGSAAAGEVMNLLARRNLLFEIVREPSPRFRVNVAVAGNGEARDPSAFAQKIRRELTDEQRTLRVYGSEVVICRVTGDAGRVRLHLLNYGGRDIEGLRIRLRGAYPTGEAYVSGTGSIPLAEQVIAEGATEFSLPRLATYAVVDLTR